MSIPVQDILDRVTDLLLDKERVEGQWRWSDDELIRWINDSRMAIATRRPQACAKVVPIELTPGTKQELPADGLQLLDIIRNMGSNGQTPGRSIRRTDRQNLDDMDLYWHKAPPSAEISQFTYDDRTPKSYYVWPPAKPGTHIEVSYAAVPAVVDATTDTFDIGLESMDAVINYVCYRAKSKDSEYANAGEAAAFYGAFADALGSTTTVQVATSPNQPGNSV